MMTIGQLEFEQILQELGAHAPGTSKLPKPKIGLNTQTYAIGLAKALRRENLPHPTFNILTVIAREQGRFKDTTIPRVAMVLGISFNAVQQHLHKSGHLFEVTKSERRKPGINVLRLSPEAIALLVKIQKLAHQYANQIA